MNLTAAELIATVYDDCPAQLTAAEQTEIDQAICTASAFDVIVEMDLAEVDQLCEAHSTTE